MEPRLSLEELKKHPLNNLKYEKDCLKVSHWCQFCPNLSGMYVGLVDQIKYERLNGIRSELLDPNNEYPPEWMRDGWLRPKPWKWAISDAHVWVLHRAIPARLKKMSQNYGTVFVMHGSAHSMLISEQSSNGRHKNFNGNISNLWNFDRSIALDENDYEIMRNYDENERLVFISDAIDLEEASLEGDKWNYTYRPAIITTDTVRITKLPAELLWAMPKVCERIPDARLNWFSFPRLEAPTYRNLLVRSKKQELSTLTETIVMQGISSLFPFVRGADIGFINEIHGRPGRTVPEKLALGIPVVSYRGKYTKYHAVAWDMDSIADAIEECWNDLQDHREKIRMECRKYAEDFFDMAKISKQYIQVYNQVADAKGLR